MVLLEPGADFVPETLLLRRQRQIHRRRTLSGVPRLAGNASVGEIEHDKRDTDPRDTREDHARVLREDGGSGSGVVAVVDQVEIAEYAVQDRLTGPEHLYSDQGAVHRVDRVADDRPGGDHGDHLVQEGQ